MPTAEDPPVQTAWDLPALTVDPEMPPVWLLQSPGVGGDAAKVTEPANDGAETIADGRSVSCGKNGHHCRTVEVPISRDYPGRA